MLHCNMTAASVLIPQTAAVMTVTATAGSRHKCEIVLFDLGTLDILVQPTMLTSDVLNAIASQLNLTEKHYFSLYYWDNQSRRRHWLLSDQQLVEQDLPWRSVSGCSSSDGGGRYSTIFCVRLCFDVRYYAESVSYMKDGVAVELFYHSARLAVCEGRIECSSDTAVELAAQALRVAFGIRTFSDLQAIAYLRESHALNHPSLDTEQVASCFEQRVLAISRGMREQTRGESMVQYMSIVEKLPTYGVAYYEVTDAAGRPWYLGLCCHGMIICDYQDRRALHRVFLWKHLENIYFRDRKFTIEIYDPQRVTHILSNFNPYENAIQEAAEGFDDLSDALCEPTTQVSISRRTFGPRSTNVYVWFTADAKLTKAIWTEAVCQHQFYLENRYNKTRQTKAMSEVAALISPAPVLSAEVLPQQPAPGPQPTVLLTSSGLTADTNSMLLNGKSSLESGRPLVSMPAVDHFIEKQAKRRRKLSQKRDELREAVKVALQELRDVCLREAVLTGTLPPEYPALPGELPPAVPRRVRTAFTISFDRDSKPELSREECEVKTLEVRYELQKQIAKATLKLVNDASLPSAVRKKHKAAYERLWGQVSELELELHRAVQRLATASSSSLRADLSSLSSGFSEDASADVNDDLKSLSIHSFPLPAHRSSAASVGHFSKVASSPQLQQYVVDDRSSMGGCKSGNTPPPPPLMPRLSASSLTSSSQASDAAAQQQHHLRRRHLSGSAAADRLSASSGGMAPNGTSVVAAGIEQRSRSPAPPTLLPRSSSSARLHSHQPVVQQPQTVGCPRRPPPLSSSLNTHQLRRLRSVDSAQQLSPAAADAWMQRSQQVAGSGRTEAALPERARPKRTGSCDDLLIVEDSRIFATGGFGVRRQHGSRDALSSSNPYGSLERPRHRRGTDRFASSSSSMSGDATAIGNAMAATWSAEKRQHCRTSWLPRDGHSQPVSLASGDAQTVAHERLMRVQSSPLPLQLMVASTEVGLSRRNTPSHAQDGYDAAAAARGETQTGGNSNSGRHTPCLLGSQPSAEPPAEPPPLLPRASRRLSSGAGAGEKNIFIAGPPAAASASSDGQPVLPARLTATFDPEQLYDAYALRLSKASQRMFEPRLPLEEPSVLWPPAGAVRLSSSACDQAGAVSSRAASHRPLGRRSAVPLPDADVVFEFGCTRSGSSRSGSSRSSSPGGGGGTNGGGPGLAHSQELPGTAVMHPTEPAVGPDRSSRASTPSAWNQPQAPGRRIGQSEFGTAAADCDLPDPVDRHGRRLSGPLLLPRRSSESGHRGSNPVGSVTCLSSTGSSLASKDDAAVVHGRHQLTSLASNHRLASTQRHGANIVGSVDGSSAAIAVPQANAKWQGRDALEEPTLNVLAEDCCVISAHHVSTLV